MNLRVVQLADEEQRAFADQFTHGRLFGSGRAFIPYIRRSSSPASSNSPAFRWIQMTRALAPAAENGPPAAPQEPERGTLPRATTAAPPPPAPPGPFVGHKLPRDRDEIGLGSIVLAHEGPDEGWWEAEVIGINGTVHSLRWRDYPTQPTILRRADELALLPPAKA